MRLERRSRFSECYYVVERSPSRAVVGDISKAHRGFTGCQIDTEETVPGDPDSQIVYVNNVGTFGLSPASYWWTRIAACGIRATHHLLGYPCKWAKTRGGYRVEWLGMETERSSYRLGMSNKRASWLSTWLNEKVTAGKISAKEMQQGPGRLRRDWKCPLCEFGVLAQDALIAAMRRAALCLAMVGQHSPR